MIGTVTSRTLTSLSGEAEPHHARTSAERRPIPGAALLGFMEAVVAVASLAAVLIATNRRDMPNGIDSFLAIRVTLSNLLLLAMLVVTWRLVFHLCGLYSMRGVRTAVTERVRVCLACSLGSLVALIIPALTTGGGLRPISILYFFVVATVATLSLRQARRSFSRSRSGRRVLIVGTGKRAASMWKRLEADDTTDYELAGFLDTAGSTPISDDVARRCIGTLDDLEPLLMRHAIDEVCVALPVRSHYLQIQDAILVCERVGVRAKYQANLFDSTLAWPRYDDPSNPTVTMHVVANDYRLIIKRAFDVAGAVAAVIALAPVMAAVALAIKATSRGPVIFAQERYGLNRRRFRMLKFRTMRTDAEALQADLEEHNEADGPVFKITNDPRVTPLGRFLRRTSLDELPQLLNVIRGEMSLVGPRPLPLRDVTRFTCSADMRRFSVRPGLTCLWQIGGRSTLTFADWIRLDLEYIDRWSLALDFLILLRTVPAVFSGVGAR
jgi:exopolysaccharide biosynthesis polyprenyl glycosylphosphotransferase